MPEKKEEGEVICIMRDERRGGSIRSLKSFEQEVISMLVQ
jgi:hypothetical protein